MHFMANEGVRTTILMGSAVVGWLTPYRAFWHAVGCLVT